MDHENDVLDAVELGAVSSDTQGDNGLPIEGGGLYPVAGLSDD